MKICSRRGRLLRQRRGEGLNSALTQHGDEVERNLAVVASLRQSVDSTQFTTAWQDGLTMSVDEAVALALEPFPSSRLGDESAAP